MSDLKYKWAMDKQKKKRWIKKKQVSNSGRTKK